MMERGKIVNRNFALQVRDFSGLRFGNITPTDIDGLLDFGGKCFVFIEAKHGNSSMPYGQKLAIERVCDACNSGGVKSIVLVGKHETDGDIDFARMQVTLLRINGKWRAPYRALTIREAIDEFVAWAK